MTETSSARAAACETLYACPETGAAHLRLPLRDHVRPGVYVGHPITGIGLDRIRAMEADLAARLAEAGVAADLFFPMRSTHLRPGETGANEYAEGAGLFSGTRHFTSQNRCDAVHHADAVLLHYDLRDDAGAYRLSRGIPFDLGWARAHGKPVVAVIGPDNPNWWPELPDLAAVVPSLDAAIPLLADRLPPESAARATAIEVLAFPADRVSLALIARLAEADARKGLGACAAVIAVLPGGRTNPNWHGQVGEVADWMLGAVPEALRVAAVLQGQALAS